jgi:hypothetical protein
MISGFCKRRESSWSGNLLSRTLLLRIRREGGGREGRIKKIKLGIFS